MNPFTMLRKPAQPDELELLKARERGARAEALLRDETLMEAFTEIERVYYEAWRSSGALDIELRERSHISINLLGDIKAQLIRFVREGEVSKKAIAREVERKQRAA